MSLLLAALAQVTPVQPLPKGTALPPPGSEEAAVMVPVTALFAAIAARDGAAALAVMRPDATTTTARELPDGSRTIRHLTAAEFAAMLKPGAERYEERLSDPAIEVDGDIAFVWGRYDFFIDGKRSHCGFDHFDLVREKGAWKIQNLTWSSRTTGCDGVEGTRSPEI